MKLTKNVWKTCSVIWHCG